MVAVGEKGEGGVEEGGGEEEEALYCIFILMLRYSTASCHPGEEPLSGFSPLPSKETEFYKISYFKSITQEFYKEVMKENIKTVKMCNIN